jgi:dihydroneopterin aldolase
MNYTTTLTGLEFFSFHGLYPEEKLMGAIFRVDVSVLCHVDKPITSLEEAVNYEIIYKTVKEQMAIPEDLLETVAQKIISVLQKEFTQARRVEVTIHKPNPAGAFKSGTGSVTLST